MPLVNYLPRPRRPPPAQAVPPHIPTLPTELWMAIAELIDPADLEGLIGVHRVFFEIVMDNRYREVKLIDSNPLRLFRRVNALKDDSLARRVKILTVWPSVVWDAIYVAALPFELRIEQPQSLPVERTTGLSQTFENHLQQRNEAIASAALSDLSVIPVSAESRRAAVVDILKRLSANVRQLHLYSKSYNPNMKHGIWPLLAQAWPAIAPQLSALLLDMPLAVLADFVASLAPTTVLTNLRKLEIVFSIDQSAVYSSPSQGKDVKNILLPFIRNHSGNLESLSITTYGSVDLSPFFRGLGHLPCLTSLSFIIPFDADHILDPLAFNDVLVNHPHLRSLTIRNRCSNFRRNLYRVPTVVTEEWLRGCFEGVSFAQLKEFRLGLNYRVGIQRNMLVAMKPICFALSSLVLLEPCLTLNDLYVVLKSLQPPRLKSLSLFLYILNTEVVDLLSECCPSLQSLTLTIEKIGDWDGNHATYLSAEEIFIETMQNCSSGSRELYSAWKLCNLEIWRWEYEAGRQRQLNLMRAFADVIPALF